MRLVTWSVCATSVVTNSRPLAVPVGQCLTPLGVDVPEYDVAPSSQETLDDARAQARGPTGDDGDLACQFVAHEAAVNRWTTGTVKRVT